jgi:hypothetical protein
MQNVYSFSIYVPVPILNGISTCLRRGTLYERRKKNIFQVTAAQLVLKIKAERMI